MRRAHPRLTSLKRLLPIAALASALVAVGLGAGSATAAAPCWKALINDWYDGRIDNVYPIHCYRDALNHLPTDVATYSSAKDDITRALQQRILASKKKPTQGSGGGGQHVSPAVVPPAAKGGGGGSGSKPTGGPSGGSKPSGVCSCLSQARAAWQ